MSTAPRTVRSGSDGSMRRMRGIGGWFQPHVSVRSRHAEITSNKDNKDGPDGRRKKPAEWRRPGRPRRKEQFGATKVLYSWRGVRVAFFRVNHTYAAAGFLYFAERGVRLFDLVVVRAIFVLVVT